MEDRRIRKTKKALHNALLTLLTTNKIEDITIQEICNLADTHRSTFYYHYDDIYALYNEVENNILDEFSNSFTTSQTHNYEETYTNIIKYIYTNKSTWSILLQQNNHHFANRVSKLIEEKYLTTWQYETNQKNFSNEFNIIVKTNISAFVTLLRETLNNNYSIESIYKILKDLDYAYDQLLEKYL